MWKGWAREGAFTLTADLMTAGVYLPLPQLQLPLHLPASGWAGNLGTSPPGCGCREAPGAVAFLARESFVRMRLPGVASFRGKGPSPAGSPWLLTFGLSWDTWWATAEASSPWPLCFLHRTLSCKQGSGFATEPLGSESHCPCHPRKWHL